MNIDKTKIKNGIWCEDVDGNYIPCDTDTLASFPKEAHTVHTRFPLDIREDVYLLKDYVEDYGCRRTYHGSDKIYTASTHIGGGNQDIIMAMVNSGDYTLSEALAVYADACERCANVLAYKYLNGKDGYPEFSEEWKKCNTVCDFCKGTGEAE